MSELGLGVMIKRLFGDSGARHIIASQGKTIASLKLDDTTDPEELQLTFTDDTGIAIYDGGQTCCETRYMTTDDDLAYFVGSTFLGARVDSADTKKDEYGNPHEQAFLVISTSLGVFTIATHNVHNGCYGGFAITAKGLNDGN